MKIDFIEFDPKTASPTQWENYHEFRKIRHQETSPEDEFTNNAIVEESQKQDSPMSENLRYHLYDGDKLIGSLTIAYLKPGTESYENNKHLILAGGAVREEYRRKGLGTQMLRKTLEIAKDLDKSLLILESTEDSGIAFMNKIGADVGLRSSINRLDMQDVDWSLVESWDEEGKARNPDTELLKFERIPDEYLDQMSKLVTEFNNQQPLDDLDVNELIVTPEMLRQGEERAEKMGIVQMNMVTKEPNGTISGLTEMVAIPGKKQLQQGITGVQLEYRGRGLGKWLKAAMLLYVRENYPNTTNISTGNADSNDAMLSINHRLGFRQHKGSINAQISIDKVEKFLNSIETISNQSVY